MAKNLESQFSGRYAVVTGGTQGIGETTARLLAERGASGIIVSGRNVEHGNRVASELTASGCPTRFVAGDLASIETCISVVDEAERTFGGLHILVNCAGATNRGTLLDTSPELYDYLFAVNARAPFFLMQSAARVMRRKKTTGAMVNIISMSGHGGQPFICAYSASKGALATLTRNAAFSLLPDRIRVNGLNIGWSDTPGENTVQRETHAAPADWLAAAESEQPFGRLLKPREIAKAVAFLVSEESGLMTGAIIDFDQSVLGCYDAAPHPRVSI